MSEETRHDMQTDAAASGAAKTEAPKQPAQKPAVKKEKPVYVYLIALFAVALILMGISLLVNHRSNQQVIGELQSSVNSMQMLQESEARNVELTEKIQQLEDQLSEQRKTIFELQQEQLALQQELAGYHNAEDAQS